MRNSFLLFVLMACMSCGGYIEEYTIFNDSDCNLVVKGYDRFREQTADPIEIGAGKYYMVERHRGESSDNRSFFSINYVDSVRLEFNSEKVLLFVCDVEPRDCRTQSTCLDCYQNLSMESSSGFNVVVTQEDCLNAEPM